MLVRLLAPVATPTLVSRLLFFRCRKKCTSFCTSRDMGLENLGSKVKKPVNFRLCNISSYTTELLEIQADDPTLQILLIPGNPGVITFYKDFVESLYELLGGNASITAIGHVAHTEKNWERGRLFSLQEQIDHKMDFIRQELPNNEVPVILVAHSIGSYISIEMLRRSSEKTTMFLTTYSVVLGDILYRTLSIFGVKSTISKAVYYWENCSVKLFSIITSGSLIGSSGMEMIVSSIISAALSHIVASLGLLPRSALRFVVSKSLGSSWSAAAVEAVCTHLPQYHVMRNILFMAKTEFGKLSEKTDWEFMRGNQDKIAFLFGTDDHWGPLQMFEEISKQAPDISQSIEREGHTHAFSCTKAGSLWVADYVANLIKNKTSSSSQDIGVKLIANFTWNVLRLGPGRRAVPRPTRGPENSEELLQIASSVASVAK
ncbi:hypothetical protein EZV62_015996 [Acer yangbiense]|uniref:Lipid droplet-associated hydrolase n=1 Tax=Acer yangbiense TaxID=1000413 RepID=A0A5C7HMB9_9ROSI|nr:hypothetical protein EZV62_015996 [Acer yangbiense]